MGNLASSLESIQFGNERAGDFRFSGGDLQARVGFSVKTLLDFKIEANRSNETRYLGLSVGFPALEDWNEVLGFEAKSGF